jgi:rubrerythrin
MSMVWLWNRIFGKPEQIEMEERAERQAREPRKEVEAGPPAGRCRVCGHEGPERYCPACLADTMVVARRRSPR